MADRRDVERQRSRSERSHTLRSEIVAGLVVAAFIGALLPVVAQSATAAGAASKAAAHAPSALYTPELLQNPGFEEGFAGWGAAPGQNLAIYQGSAYEDSHYLETNTGSAGSGGGILQSVATTPAASHSYQASVALRSPAGQPVRVGVALIASGGGLASDVQTTGVTIRSRQWHQVFVALPVARNGYTALALVVYLVTTGVNLDVDAATLRDAGLFNSSFENGFNHWQDAGANVAIYSGAAAEDTHFLETSRRAPGGFVYQDLATAPVAGHSYRAQALMRSPSGRRVRVVMGLAARGGRKERRQTVAVVSSRAWTLVSVELDVTAGSGDDLRVTFTPMTPGVNVDVDATSLCDAGLQNAAFEQGFSHWAASPGQNVAVYAGRALEDTHYLETNTGSAGAGGGIVQDVAATAVQGDAYDAEVALRSPTKAPVEVGVVLSALGGSSPAESQTTGVQLTSRAWQRVPVELDITNPGYTDLRLQVYLATPGVNVDVDAAGISQAPDPPGLDPLRSAIVQTAISQDQNHAAVTETPYGSNCNVYTTYWQAGSTGPCYVNGVWNGLRSESWCADFAAWVWHMGGAPAQWGYNPGEINGWSYTFVGWGVDNATLKVGATNDPVPGDAVVWGSTAQAYGQHVGIVVGVENGLIDVVSGNSGPLVDGDNVMVWNSGWFNPATSTINGYGIIGYIAPESLSTSVALPAHTAAVAPQLQAPLPRRPNSYVGIVLPGKLTRKQLAQRIAAQDGGR